MRNEYTTRQREQILAYFQQHAGGHVTADELLEHLRRNGLSLGKATVYRTLERLVQQNVIRRYSFGVRQSACYQYILGEECHRHFHLKCVECGRLFHVECSLLEQTSTHIGQQHDFTVDPSQTVFYGRCGQCAKSEALPDAPHKPAVSGGTCNQKACFEKG